MKTTEIVVEDLNMTHIAPNVGVLHAKSRLVEIEVFLSRNIITQFWIQVVFDTMTQCKESAESMRFMNLCVGLFE